MSCQCNSVSADIAIHSSSPELGYIACGAYSGWRLPCGPRTWPLISYSIQASPINKKFASCIDRSMYCPFPVRSRCNNAKAIAANPHSPATGSGYICPEFCGCSPSYPKSADIPDEGSIVPPIPGTLTHGPVAPYAERLAKTISGLIACSASYPNPRLFITRGEKFSATKSKWGRSSINKSLPSGFDKSIVTQRLFKLTEL